MARKRALKGNGKVVLASGTFDLLHMGHVKYLEEAKKAGGKNAKLIVIVARDKTATKRKGAKPVVPENHRRALVEALAVVDEAIIRQVQDVIASKGLDIQVKKIGKFGKDELNSSLKIKRQIIELYRR